MMKMLYVAVALAGMALATSAQASVFNMDFAALAYHNEGDVEGNIYHFGDLSVTLSSSSHAYLDDLSGGLPAGLGVCETVNSSRQCSPSYNDNISAGEWVTLTFNKVVNILAGTTFRDDNHHDISDSLSTLLVSAILPNGLNTGLQQFSFGRIHGSSSIPLRAITFLNGGQNPDNFYVNSISFAAVPLPAALPLFGAALAGLGLVAGRRKRTPATA